MDLMFIIDIFYIYDIRETLIYSLMNRSISPFKIFFAFYVSERKSHYT